ncbi:MAG: ribose-5-phosphate isomerase RpiA [Pseudomonadota bacterium]|nr:ribose-5-phosphate isomerase RpiA [Pseudomonadota bacterium]
MDKEEKKKEAAKKALEIIVSDLNEDTVLGIGTGSTTNYFIELLKKEKINIKGLVCSSNASKKLFDDSNFQILELNDVYGLDFYIDGADEFNERLELIKGGGGALTREKILSNSSDKFICIVDDSKYSKKLGSFPLPLEVIDLARSAISREVLKMGGKPVFRKGFVSDNGNQIIDVHNLNINVPFEMEMQLNFIPGVLENGIFSNRKADILLKADNKKVEVLEL